MDFLLKGTAYSSDVQERNANNAKPSYSRNKPLKPSAGSVGDLD